MEIVGLLAALCITIGLVTGAAMRYFQIRALDDQLMTASRRVTAFDQQAGSIQVPGSPPVPQPLTNAPGVTAETVLARIVGQRVTDAGMRDRTTGAQKGLSAHQMAALRKLPLGRPVTRYVSGLGEYRLVATRAADGDLLVTGLPMAPVYLTQFRLVTVEACVSLITLAVAALVGMLVIRKTLRPLERIAATARTVAELPLDRGEVTMPLRVPKIDVDPRTEVGQVAVALDRMLSHVADALSARQAAETRLRHFCADASHELRTPLAVIRGYAELTRRVDDLPPDVARAMHRVESETARMTGLVEDLLRLARLDSDRPPAAEPVDLSQLVIDAVSAAHIAGPDHHWRLELPEEPVMVTGDAANLHRAVENLLANGRVHTPPGTTVITSLTATEEQATLSVVDNGPGIVADLLPHAFDRFVRGDTSSRSATDTGGLGLAIVKAVAEAHGGSVEVSSRVGQTAFTIRLPIPRRGHHARPEDGS